MRTLRDVTDLEPQPDSGPSRPEFSFKFPRQMDRRTRAFRFHVWLEQESPNRNGGQSLTIEWSLPSRLAAVEFAKQYAADHWEDARAMAAETGKAVTGQFSASAPEGGIDLPDAVGHYVESARLCHEQIKLEPGERDFYVACAEDRISHAMDCLKAYRLEVACTPKAGGLRLIGAAPVLAAVKPPEDDNEPDPEGQAA